jgi:hypothetical protein
MKKLADIRWALILMVIFAALSQTSCGYVAAGVVGAGVGHEIAEEEQEEEEEEAENEG